MIIPHINRKFDGFLNTPFLWEGSMEGLEMFKKDDLKIENYPSIDADSHIRLGKLIEQFVLFELAQDDSIEVLKSNVQVFEEIGELDCLLTQLAKNIHLEIVYKFYLYDPSIPTELHRWIGPNRNDNLVHKIKKLKEKQLPLLYHSQTAHALTALNLTSDDFIQQLYFKAQLFVPFEKIESAFPFVNNDCIQGYYIRPQDLGHFRDYSFYIPAKLDWLVAPHSGVTWMTFETFKEHISKALEAHQSPLCWMQSPGGRMEKMFVVWWE